MTTFNPLVQRVSLSLVVLFLSTAMGCSPPDFSSCFHDQQSGITQFSDVCSDTVTLTEHTDTAGNRAQEFTVKVATQVQDGTMIVLYVNGRQQSLRTYNGTYMGPRPPTQYSPTEQERLGCGTRPTNSVYTTTVGVVTAPDLEAIYPLTRTFMTGDTFTMRVDVCNATECQTGTEQTVTVR